MSYDPRVPSKLNMLIDTREKIPILFPATLRYYTSLSDRSHHLVHVRTTRRKLRTGDYYLDGHRSVTIWERKAGAEEIHNNILGKQRKRFLESLDRLQAATRHPYLLIDSSPAQMLRHSEWATNPTLVINALYRECVTRGIAVWWIGNAGARSTRIAMGTVLLHAMLTHIVHPGVSRAEKPLPSLAKEFQEEMKLDKQIYPRFIS